MTNPTRDQILRAYTALTGMCELVERRAGYRPDEYERAILEALPPKPFPTMADIEWLDSVHYLAEADTPELGKVVMLRKMDSGFIEFIKKPYTPLMKAVARPEYFTPTGRRYTLTEVQE
ncbi:hypothetical protein ACUY2G_12265 [Corynebacterium guaraldiae]